MMFSGPLSFISFFWYSQSFCISLATFASYNALFSQAFSSPCSPFTFFVQLRISGTCKGSRADYGRICILQMWSCQKAQIMFPVLRSELTSIRSVCAHVCVCVCVIYSLLCGIALLACKWWIKHPTLVRFLVGNRCTYQKDRLKRT